MDGGNARHSRCFATWNNSATLGIVIATVGLAPSPDVPSVTVSPVRICGAIVLQRRVYFGRVRSTNARAKKGRPGSGAVKQD